MKSRRFLNGLGAVLLCMSLLAGLGFQAQAADAVSAPRWKTTTIDASGSVGTQLSLALDPANDTPYISYLDVANHKLRLAYWVGEGGNCGENGTWSCQEVPDLEMAGSGWNSSIDVYRSSQELRIGIVYLAENPARVVRYARYSCFSGRDCSWSFATIYERAGYIPVSPSLKFDSLGHPNISFIAALPEHYFTLEGFLYFAEPGTRQGNCGGGLWQCSVVDYVNNSGIGPGKGLTMWEANLDLGYDDQPYIAYFWGSFLPAPAQIFTLKVAHQTGFPTASCGAANTWACDIVDQNISGKFNNPVVHAPRFAEDALQMTYFESYSEVNETFLKYARQVGAAGNCGSAADFSCQYIETLNGAPGGMAPLYLDSNHQPVIAFSNWVNVDDDFLSLKVATPAQPPAKGNCLVVPGPKPVVSPWYCSPVDLGGQNPDQSNKGFYSSAAYTSHGKAVIAYAQYVGGSYSLKFAAELERTWVPVVR